MDKGWLLQPPENPKLYCPHCDYWHDTKVEVTKCKKSHKVFIDKHTIEAKKEMMATHNENELLRQEVNELKEMVKKLLEAKK